MNNVATSMIGQSVRGYRLEALLGSGGMGSVYAARHAKSDETVAIKVLAEDLLSSPSAVARFMREASVVAKLGSPHSVRVLRVGKLASGAPYMVMELLSGEDLATVLDRSGGVLPSRDAVALITQACEAAGEAHDAGIVHRDLKLSNLFVDDCPDRDVPFLKVLDFGLAKPQYRAEEERTAASLTAEGTFIGTPRYMAPEQIVGSRDVDSRSDVWALGVCLYRLVTGRMPFDAANVQGVSLQILSASPAPPRVHVPAIEPALEAIIMRCLVLNPRGRYADANALGRALRDLTFEAEAISDWEEPRTPIEPESLHPQPVGLDRTVVMPRQPVAPAPPGRPAESRLPSLQVPSTRLPSRPSYASGVSFAYIDSEPAPAVATLRRRYELGIGLRVLTVLVLLALLPLVYLAAREMSHGMLRATVNHAVGPHGSTEP